MLLSSLLSLSSPPANHPIRQSQPPPRTTEQEDPSLGLNSNLVRWPSFHYSTVVFATLPPLTHPHPTTPSIPPLPSTGPPSRRTIVFPSWSTGGVCFFLHHHRTVVILSRASFFPAAVQPRPQSYMPRRPGLPWSISITFLFDQGGTSSPSPTSTSSSRLACCRLPPDRPRRPTHLTRPQLR